MSTELALVVVMGGTEEVGHDGYLTGVPSSIRDGEGSEGESLHCLT